MNYNFNNLYFGLVEYYDKNKYKLDVHALYNDGFGEELFDLDLKKPILTYGEDEKYYIKSLISFNDVLYRSRISWGNLSYGDAIKLKELYLEHYFDFLRIMGINSVDDLISQELEENHTQAKRRK